MDTKDNENTGGADKGTAIEKTGPEKAPAQRSGLLGVEARRRTVLKHSGVTAGLAAAWLLGGAGRALSGVGNANTTNCPQFVTGPEISGAVEMRDFVFKLPRGRESRATKYWLVVGTRRTRLKRMTGKTWKRLLRDHPILRHVPESERTHHVQVSMPADRLQYCFVRLEENPGNNKGAWGIAQQFFHHPRFALREAMGRTLLKHGEENHPVPIKWERFGLQASDILAYADPVGMDVLKDNSDTAAALIQAHPEMYNSDPTSSAYICQSIVNGDPATKSSATQCGQVIDALGCIMPAANFSCSDQTIVENTQGYGTNIPICDEDNDPPTIALNCFGDKQYVPVYNDAVASTSGQAMVSGLAAVKDDTTLGANNNANSTPTDGVIWRSNDGVTYTEQGDGLETTAVDYTTNNRSPNRGYSCTVTGTSLEAGLNGVIDLELKNWYVRFLGIYVRYLDAYGNFLKTSDVTFTQEQYDTYFPLGNKSVNAPVIPLDTTYDHFITLLGPEFEILGVPLEETTTTIKVPVPVEAVTAQIVASGMGNTKQSVGSTYEDSQIVGKTMTGTMNLAVPGLFMFFNAAAAMGPLAQSLREFSQLAFVLPITVQTMADSFASSEFESAAQFKSLGISVAKVFVGKSAGPLIDWIFELVGEGMTEEEALEAIPIVGMMMAAIYAIGAAASIAQTSAEVANSPPTYLFEVNLVHDIEVSISPDPRDAEGKNWPATAKTMEVCLNFSAKGTPIKQTYTFPAGANLAPVPIVLTFKDVPSGGNVTAHCLVEAESGFTVGRASTDPVENDIDANGQPLAIDFDITEVQIPLTAQTKYTHNEVIVLDANGEHKWNPTTMPPSETMPSGGGFSNGQVRTLSGITINSTAGDVGYVWEAYNDAVGNCVNNGVSQLYQFANISTTADPESGYFFSGCGFTEPPFVVYDLLNTKNNYYLDTLSSSNTQGYRGIIRQIRLDDTPPDFDAPGSNKAFGKIRFQSSALLLHPAGQIVSIAGSENKVEVLTLIDEAVDDADAPFSLAYGGEGLRPGLMGGPTLAALAVDGSILILERNNERIQAFDLQVNPVPKFAQGAYFVPLRKQDSQNNVTYLDMGVDFKGYIFVLYELTPKSGGGDTNFVLDIYNPDGSFLASTPDFIAARMTVNYWRDIFTQNFQVLKLPNGSYPDRTEPSISHWIPSTPSPSV